jgi:hypothetical protein
MSRYPRWHYYAVFNRIANKPIPIPKPRPEWVVSRKYIPLVMSDDHSIVNAAQRSKPAGVAREGR